MIIREAIQKTVFSDISFKQNYASVMLPTAYYIKDYNESYEYSGLKPTRYAVSYEDVAYFDSSISSHTYRLVSPINDLPYNIENIDITEQPKTFDDIDEPFVTSGTNVLNKYDYDLCRFIETEPIEFNSTYWADLLRPSNFATLSFYEQHEKYKVFDCCTYSINNSYLDDMYNELYRSFDNVRRFTRESSDIIKTFSEYVSDNYSRAIVFEGLKENDINILDNESYISVYLKTLQLSNTDLFFKTSYNVHIDYDGQLHFFNKEVGYITAYCTSEPSLRKTIEVRTESEITYEISSETKEDILTIDEFLKENHYTNEVNQLILCGDNEIITSVNITNGSGALTPIMPKVKLIDNKTINLIALGKGSFSINYSIFNIETAKLTTYNLSFIIKEKPICHAKNLLEFSRIDDIINVKLNTDYMAPVTIVAQYNGYDKNDNYVSEHLVKGFDINYLYTDASWATIEINASPDVDKTKIPVRIYFINYDNTIYYQDWHPDTSESIKGTFFSLRKSAGQFIDYLGNEYGKKLKQPLYNVEKVSKISPFVKISLALSEKPFNTNTSYDNTVVNRKFNGLNTVDISCITNGLNLTATQSKTISTIEKRSITNYRLDNSISESLITYVSNNINKYLSLEGFDVNKSVFRPKALSYIDTLLDNYSLNLNESFTDTPIFIIDNPEDTDVLSPWNVIPDIKVTNPTIEYNIEEYFGKIRRGCFYQVSEKNYDLTFSKNSEFDSEFEDSHIEIRITDKDYIIITFGIKEINILKNGQLKSEYMIDEDSIYITGKLDNKTVNTKYSTNCSRELTLGNIIVYSLSGRDSFNIVLGVLNSRKRVSLTFVINEYNVVNDDLIIDTLESKDISIEPFDYTKYWGRYVKTSYTSLDTINLNAENDSIRDTWFTYKTLPKEKLNYSLSQSSLKTASSNSYCFCDITYNVTDKNCTYIVKFIGEKDSNLQPSFAFNPTSYVRIPKDLTRVVIDNDYYNILMRNADLMGIAKDNEYELCFDAEKILSMCYKSVNVDKTIYIETNQETGEDEAVCGDIRVPLKDIKVNVHILCKNKLIVIHQNVPITESFKFCYEDYFAKYGHINGIVISDSDNNPLQILSLDVSFIPYIKANSIIKRIYDTPVMFFDDAASQIKSNGDYDNLLPNFSLYRDKLALDITEDGKLGNLSKLDYNNLDSYTYLLSINNKFSPIVISYNTSNAGSLKSYLLKTDNSKEAISFDTDVIYDIKINDDNIISPYSMQYIGYVMYYLNMAYLKKLNWLKLTDSEDIIYYLILLDKLSNNEDNFYKFKEEYLKSIDINGIRNVNLFENSWFKMTIKYIDFFERNYDKIVNEWQNRIDAYQLLLDVLSEYDSSVDLAKQIDKYIDKIPNIDDNKREKIYYIVTEKTTNNIKQDSWAISQINNRIWDNSSMHYIWKNVFEIMFKDQFNFDIINDAILRDINNYGFYPIIQIPEMDENDMYIPYRLSFEGKIEESFIDGKHVWNGAQEPIYNYIFNDNGQIIGISRLFELDKPLIKSWKTNKIPSLLEDKNGNTVFDYFIKDEDGDGWGMLIDKNNFRYNINIKGQFIKYDTSKTPTEYRITNNFDKNIDLIDILNNWEDNVFYKYDELIEQKSELLSDEVTSTILEYNTFLDTYKLVTENFEDKWIEILKQQAYTEWKDKVIFYEDENGEYQLVNEKDELNSSKNYKYFYKVICKYGKDSTDYKKLSSITFERLLGKDYTKTVNYFGDVSDYWIDEDKSNLIKMKSNNLLEAIRVQKLLAELFISELNKTMYMINSLMIFKDMSTIVDNLKSQWEEKNGLTNLSYIDKDYKRLLDFNLTYFTSTYNCIYTDDKTFGGIYSYAYQYYNGYTHTINEYTGSDAISINLPTSALKVKYTDHIQINDDMLNLHLIIPQNSIFYSKSANISTYISETAAYVIVKPKNSNIKKFGIYPWNANKINITNDENASQVASWSTSNIDLSGLPNFRDYDRIANYREIDGNGFVNSYVVMRRLMAGDLDSAPAIEIAYNFYPEELLGTEKYTAYQYTYDYTVSMNSILPWQRANTTYSYSYNLINTGNYKTNVFSISRNDLHLYSYTIVEQKKQQSLPSMDAHLSFMKFSTDYSYHYSYVLHSRPTYILSYKYGSSQKYVEEIIYDGIRDVITTSIYSSNPCYQGYAYSYQNNFNIIKNRPYSYYSGLNLTIENILGLESANDNNVESSNDKINGFTISYCDYLNRTIQTVKSTTNYAYSYLAFKDINACLSEIKPLSYKITLNRTGNFAYFVIDNRITFDSGILDINRKMYNAYSFFLGSVSQWQVVQDNVREINNALAYIYDNAPYTYKKTTYEDALNNYTNGNYYYYGSSYENVTTEPQSNGVDYYVYSKIPEPDYFYDGRIDRDKDCNKIFWTSSEIDSKNAWIMFFDKYMLQNNNKLCGAYVRPFINKI